MQVSRVRTGVTCYTSATRLYKCHVFVQVFCVFTGLSLLFIYVAQLTLFSACLVLDGRREAAQRHCLTFRKLTNRSVAR